MPYRIGVDLGTTSVRAAVHDGAGVRVVRLGDRTPETPAVVYLRRDGELITGRGASSRSVTNPLRVARGFTRLLGEDAPVVLGGQPFTVSELLEALLRDVLERVSEAEGGPPEAAVLTYPACWGPDQREALMAVAAAVGLPPPVLVSAPEAVAAHWAAENPTGVGALAVYDLGGGTLDTAVLRGAGLRSVAVRGLRWGGMDVDEALLRHVDRRVGGALSALGELSSAAGKPHGPGGVDPAAASALVRVRQDCIRTKEALSAAADAHASVILPEQRVDVPVSRADLEDLIAGPVAVTADTLVAALDWAAVPAGELAAVLLVGGSARIPLVARVVSERLGRPVTVADAREVPVAAGAAALAGKLTDEAVRRPTRAARHAPATASGPAPASPADPSPPSPAPRRSAPRHSAPRHSASRRSVPPSSRPPSSTSSGHTLAAQHGLVRSPSRLARLRSAACHRRLPLLVGLAAAFLVGALVVLWPSGRPQVYRATGPSLELTTNAVSIGESYYATAAGFVPGESVQLSWTGPTEGVMGVQAADPSGMRRHGPILERDPPGRYEIAASGLASGRTATTWLQVLPAK